MQQITSIGYSISYSHYRKRRTRKS